MAEANARPWGWLDGMRSAAIQWPFVGRFGRDIRVTVTVCTIVICGSFSATALLQMRLDRSHALSQAQQFEPQRAADLADAAAATLNRYARMGMLFAAGPEQY